MRLASQSCRTCERICATVTLWVISSSCVCACAYLERAQHALHSPAADTQRATDLQYARAALVEAQDGLFQLSPAHAPALFICASLATLDLDHSPPLI